MVEGNRVLTLGDETLIEDVEHLEERHVLADVWKVITHHAARILGALLSPDVKYEIHYL
jgi:hypothetical protein